MEKTMKKIALLVLPFLLLTGCNKSTRAEVSESDWQKEAQNRVAKVNEAVNAKNFYLMLMVVVMLIADIMLFVSCSEDNDENWYALDFVL